MTLFVCRVCTPAQRTREMCVSVVCEWPLLTKYKTVRVSVVTWTACTADIHDLKHGPPPTRCRRHCENHRPKYKLH